MIDKNIDILMKERGIADESTMFLNISYSFQFTDTNLNKESSRSHAIFTLKLVKGSQHQSVSASLWKRVGILLYKVVSMNWYFSGLYTLCCAVHDPLKLAFK